MTAPITNQDDAGLQEKYRAALRRWGGSAGVTGVDIGYEYDEKGNQMEGLVVRVHSVRELPGFQKKMRAKQESKTIVVFDEIETVVFDEVETELKDAPVHRVRATYFTHGEPTTAATSADPGDAGHPGDADNRVTIQPGMEVAHRRRTGGTLGAIVFDATGAAFLLSAGHVLRGPDSAEQQNNQSILAPTYKKGGREPDAKVGDFDRAMEPPLGDAAIARLADGRKYKREQLGTQPFVTVNAATTPTIGEVVEKSGAATGITRGRVDGIGRYYLSPTDKDGVPGFRIVALPDGAPDISDFGDSGAVWYQAEGEHKGLGIHVGGAGTDLARRPAIACCLSDVLAHFQMRLTP